MSLLSLPRLREAPNAVLSVIGKGFGKPLLGLLPNGLYARSILIVILPMLILQSVITFVFMERYWALVTNRLSLMLTQDIAAIVEIYQAYPKDKDTETLTRIAQDRMKMDIEFLPKGPLPPTLPKPFFSIVDVALSNEIRKQIGRPFWLDTGGAPISSRSASSSTTPFCASSPSGAPPMRRIPTFSFSGCSAPPSC